MPKPVPHMSCIALGKYSSEYSEEEWHAGKNWVYCNRRQSCYCTENLLYGDDPNRGKDTRPGNICGAAPPLMLANDGAF